MQRILLSAILSGLAFAALAQPPADAPQPPPANEKPLNDKLCLRHTGSRVVAARNAHTTDPAQQQCANASGRVHTAKDLRRTGELTLAEALRRLDPSIH